MIQPNYSPLPDKVPGKHRWVVNVVYALPEDFAFGRSVLVLDPSAIVIGAISCFDCDETIQRGETTCLKPAYTLERDDTLRPRT